MEPVFRMTNAEQRLAELLWKNEPIVSREMIRLAEQELGWKKSTTFSILKYLINKGLAQNESSVVTMVFNKEDYIARKSIDYVDETFGGSLPLFVASFVSSRKLTPDQLNEMRKLIEAHDEGGTDG